jgi:outer membrane protein assembly factor BamA
MAKNCNVIAPKGYFSKNVLDKIVEGHGRVIIEFIWHESRQIYVIAMEGNPKSSESQLKDLIWKAGYRNGLEWHVQPEWEIYYKPEGFIRYQ